MHDKNDKIIYVGKAVSLKNRVRQYFRKTNKTKRIENMVALIDHFEYIVTDNEAEALILECNLIKKNMPKFNVLLKDDKTYPYIKVNIKADYPDVYITRRILNDGAKYFGPYANAGSAKEMVDFIKTKFKIRQCKTFKYKDRPCLNYHIKKCLAPCMGYISKEEYMEQINQIIDLLEGKTDKIIRQLKKEMEEASIKFEYEKAAYIRDKILAIDNISKRQKVSNLSENDIDVIGIAKSKYQVCLEMFFIRNSKMIGRKHYFLANIQDEEDSEILSSFIKQYYVGNPILPHKIMIKENIEDKEIIEKSLTEQAGRKVEIKAPQKGEKLRLVEMAENNAKVTLENKEKDKSEILLELKNNISAFAGNSGVGKSTLINDLFKENVTQEGEISQKNKRGKNTTTDICLYELDTDTYIADTPGFSTFDVYEIPYRELDKYFIEFKNCIDKCRYIGCSHIKEDECGIKLELEQGKIAKSRYDNYVKIYSELKDKEEHKW